MHANKKNRKGTETTTNDNGHTSLVENNGPNDDDTKEHDTKEGATKEYDQRSTTNDKEHDKVHTKEHDKEYDQRSTPTTKEYTKEHDKEYDQRSDDTKEYDTKVGTKENDRTIVDFLEDDGLTTLEESNGAVVEKTSVLLARSLTKKAANAPAAGGTCTDPDPATAGTVDYVKPGLSR